MHQDKHNHEGVPQGIIDHIDNNQDNNTLENMQLLCRPCNTAKNAQNHPADSLATYEMTASERKNASTEHLVRGWLMAHASSNLTVDDSVNATAEIFKLSPVTTARYIRKITSPAGPLAIWGGRIVFKNDDDTDAWLKHTED